nr:MAG: YvrJ protein family protein [Bacteriophage sp.]
MKGDKSMDISVIMQAITTVGFPIVMCLCLAWYCMKLNDSHKAETDKFTTALNDNTLILQKLCDILNVERSDNNE